MPLTASASSSSSAEPAWRIVPQGDRCLLVSFGDEIDATVGRICLAAARIIRDASIAGVTDVVPSFVAVAVHYRPDGHGLGPTYSQLVQRIEQLLAPGIPTDSGASREVEVPVCYGGEHGPDLEDVARAAGITPAEVIALHSDPTCMVFMLGFAPGHAYLGVHDERLNLPRRPSPRTAVPIGAVAIANRQTVIYPNRLPGGWNIIGTTPLTMFDPERDPAAYLQPGDVVRFVPISPAEFTRIQEGRS